MTDRRADLESLVDRCRREDAVVDAWLAKSFTDLLLVVEVPEGGTVPTDLVALLDAHDVVGYNEVHDVPAPDVAAAGAVADRERFRFVDLESRGTQQSYVVE